MDVSFITGPPKLIVTVGIPGAGKTTWVEQHLPPSVVRVRPEGIRHEVYGHTPQRLEGEKEAEVWRRAEHETAEALRAGRTVVLDSMALTRDWRARIIRNVERALGRRVKRVAVFLDTPLGTALARNAGRGKHIREEVLYEMARHLQPPKEEECFDRIIRICQQDG